MDERNTRAGDLKGLDVIQPNDVKYTVPWLAATQALVARINSS